MAVKMNSTALHALLVLVVLISLCLSAAHAGLADKFIILNDIDGATPTAARNLRAAAKYHFKKASDAQNMMFKAENDDDVDAYEKWLEIMREEDAKWTAKRAEYDQVRDILESKIRTGELIIEDFTPRYEKGAVASIFDHITGRART